MQTLSCYTNVAASFVWNSLAMVIIACPCPAIVSHLNGKNIKNWEKYQEMGTCQELGEIS